MTQRTPPQNRSLHKYCNDLAHELNMAGYDFNDGRVIRLPVSFTKENTKKYIFHRVMRSLYPDIDSTADLTTVQMQDVYENVNRITAEQWGISVPWPSNEPPMEAG